MEGSAEALWDVNALVGGLLRDMAFAQESPHKAFGYKRAASSVLALDRPLTAVVRPDGTLERIPGIGPASTRIILEALETQTSTIVDAAVARSARRADIERRRRFRGHFLSRAAVLKVLSDPRLEGPTLADYRGDFQIHSEWSDGSATLEELAEACAARGYQHAAVTDHSHGLTIAGGMSLADAAAQGNAIDRINASAVVPFRLIKGIEANIGADGGLDLDVNERARFELVLAAPHARLRSSEDQTSRMLRAVETPQVHILAHPRGRMMGTRGGVVADWDAVFAAAASCVAIEIDGDPFRQDADYLLAARARDAGCLFALDSDAHAPDQLRYVETAVAHARLAAIPPERIVNCWDGDRLFTWLRDRTACVR
jgi:histidinol phosphatase-like PHP family hydrolase